MPRGRLLTVCALTLGVAACSAEQDAGQMADVTGQQIDAALSAIENAGSSDDVDSRVSACSEGWNAANWQAREHSLALENPSRARHA